MYITLVSVRRSVCWVQTWWRYCVRAVGGTRTWSGGHHDSQVVYGEGSCAFVQSSTKGGGWGAPTGPSVLAGENGINSTRHPDCRNVKGSLQKISIRWAAWDRLDFYITHFRSTSAAGRTQKVVVVVPQILAQISCVELNDSSGRIVMSVIVPNHAWITSIIRLTCTFPSRTGARCSSRLTPISIHCNTPSRIRGRTGCLCLDTNRMKHKFKT